MLSLLTGLVSKLFLGFIQRWLELERAKKSGMNQQTLASLEKVNATLQKWAKIDGSIESDSDAIDRLSKHKRK